MRRRVLVAVPLIGVLLLPLQAGAATVPRPTLRIVTIAAGTPLPVMLLHGQWASGSARANSLHISGLAVSGTTTTVHAVWTSAWGWSPAKTRAISVGMVVDGQLYLPGLRASDAQFLVQMRTVGGPWRNEMGMGSSQPYSGPFFELTDDESIDLSEGRRAYVQYRVLFSATVTGTYQEGYTLSTRVFTS